MVKKLLFGIGLLYLLASPVMAFGNDNAPNVPGPKLGIDLPLPTLPEPAKPKAKIFCGEGC
jgi:hypothetical protein